MYSSTHPRGRELMKEAIWSVVPEGGFAARAGLQADDLIMSIDGKHTRYMTLKKAVELIKNSKEGAVKLVIRRKTIIWRSKEL